MKIAKTVLNTLKDKNKLKNSINDMILQTSYSNRNKFWDESEKKTYISSLQKLRVDGEFKKYEYGAIYY